MNLLVDTILSLIFVNGLYTFHGLDSGSDVLIKIPELQVCFGTEPRQICRKHGKKKNSELEA